MIPGPQSIEAYELVHGDKPDKEARLDELFQGLRQRLDKLTAKQDIDSAVDQLLTEARQIYPDYPKIT